MRCPLCGHVDTRVLESRPTEEGAVIRRRRSCPQCEERFTTYERMEMSPLVVIKRDGTREEFNRTKVLQGLLTACHKRPVPLAELEQVVARLEAHLRSRLDHEVHTSYIGEIVMEELKRLDPIAYVRFASVYRSFADATEFRAQLDQLLEREPQKGVT